MKLVYQYMAIFFTFSPTSTHLHPLQVENCDSNSRLVVDLDDNDKIRLERVKVTYKSIGLGVKTVLSMVYVTIKKRSLSLYRQMYHLFKL